jgi:hypothetical protein
MRQVLSSLFRDSVTVIQTTTLGQSISILASCLPKSLARSMLTSRLSACRLAKQGSGYLITHYLRRQIPAQK